MKYLDGDELYEYIGQTAQDLAYRLLKEHLYSEDHKAVDPDMQVGVKASILLSACKQLLGLYEEIEKKVKSGELSREELEGVTDLMNKDNKKEWN